MTNDQQAKQNVVTDDPWGGLIALCVTITLCLLVLHWAGVI